MSKDEKAPRKGKKIAFWLIFNPLTAIILAVAILACICLPPYMDTLGADPVYTNVFVAALGDKYHRLCSVEEPKLALIGGSSVAFGLDSRLLASHLGREVVNFGLYATLGSKIMLDLSEDGLNEGDIAVFAPELDSQTLSLYFDGRTVWQAIDANRDLLGAVAAEDRAALWDSFPDFREAKQEYLDEGTVPNPSGVYNRSSFNKYGDISYPRPYNVMGLGYDPNTLFSLSVDIVSQDFIDYFNAYCDRMRAKGVTVYFSFCPINELALEEGVDSDAIAELEKYFKDNLHCKVISSLQDYIMDYGYFYDTNLHLNDAGVIARTNQLILDLTRELGIIDRVTVEVPPPPGLESGDVALGDNSFLNYFIYEPRMLGDSIIGYSIVGLSELGMESAEEEIRLPSSYQGTSIIRLEADVLSGIDGLCRVTVGDNISSMADGAFRGCERLTDVYMEFSPSDCSVTVLDQDNPVGLMMGASEDIKLHVYSSLYQDFTNDYTWGHYARYIVGDME